MIGTKKFKYRPIYKKFLNLKTNVQNKQKIFKFKKKKWKIFLFHLTKSSTKKKKRGYYKFYDQNSYYISRYNNFFLKNYKQNVETKKRFNLFFGSLGAKYLKAKVSQSHKKSNQIKNIINSTSYFNTMLERRLDIVLVKSHFVLSVRNARQLISHSHVYINNKIINDSSILVKKGDSITFSKKIHKLLKYYIAISELWPLPPTYLQINYKLFNIKVIDNNISFNNFSNNYLWLNLNDVMKSYIK